MKTTLVWIKYTEYAHAKYTDAEYTHAEYTHAEYTENGAMPCGVCVRACVCEGDRVKS